MRGEEGRPVPILLDVDTGIDDALALLYLLGEPRAKLLGITAMEGSVPLAQVARNTLAILRLCGREDIPVALGAQKPLLGRFSPSGKVSIHGENGLGNVSILDPVRRPEPCRAVELMARLIEESPERVTVVAVAAMTNLATFLLCYPHLKEKIEQLVLMGGAAWCRGNFSPVAEANIGRDPEAAQVVFSAGIPIKLAGLDVTYKAYATAAEREAWRDCGTRAGRFAWEMFVHYAAFYEGAPGCALHDPLAAAWALDEALVKALPAHLEADLCGRTTRGATVVDVGGAKTGRPCNALVGVEVDREAFARRLLAALRRLP